MSFVTVPGRVLSPDEIRRYHDDGVVMMQPGDILMFHPLTLHGSYGNSHRTRRRRALALRWTGDEVVWAPSAKRMPVHYRHDSIAGGPLSGAAFPRILPAPIAAEREARRFAEAASKTQMTASLLNNLVAATRLKLRAARQPLNLQQTWGRP